MYGNMNWCFYVNFIRNWITLKYDVAVVEDAAQAHGAQIGNIKAGAFGNGGCFSFYPGKNRGA